MDHRLQTKAGQTKASTAVVIQASTDRFAMRGTLVLLVGLLVLLISIRGMSGL